MDFKDYLNNLDLVEETSLSYQNMGTLYPQLKQKYEEAIEDNHHLKRIIDAMESSKFWKLRTQWIDIKKRLKIIENDDEMPFQH